MTVDLKSILGFEQHPDREFIYVQAASSVEFELFRTSFRIMPGVRGPSAGSMFGRENMLTTPDRERFFPLQVKGDTAGWRRAVEAWAEFKQVKLAAIEGTDLVIDGTKRISLNQCTRETTQLSVADEARLTADSRRRMKERAKRRQQEFMAESRDPADQGTLDNPLKEVFSLSDRHKYGDVVGLARASLSSSEPMLPVTVYFPPDDEVAHDDDEQARLHAALESDFNTARKRLTAEFGPSWLGKRDPHSGEWDAKSAQVGIVAHQIAWWSVGDRELFIATSKEDRETPFILVVGALPKE
jgi:hypothetical protein